MTWWALLRPPIFTTVFMCLWCLAVSVSFVLSFYGPSSTAPVHWLLAGMLLVPLLIVVATFAVEARVAARTLRQVFAAGTD